MKAAEVAAMRLHDSGLTRARFDRPDDVVRHHGAMQAQDHGLAKWSVVQRCSTVRDEDVERALTEGTIVRTHVLRATWHYVAREDLRALLALTGSRVQQHNAPRYRELGLDTRTRTRCESIVATALAGGNHLARDGIAAVLNRAGIDGSGQRLAYILMHCELEAVICSGGYGNKRHTYALVDERLGARRAPDRDVTLVELVRRYLTGHGPATVRDLRWWSSLKVADIRCAIEALGPRVTSESVDGLTLWRLADDAGRVPRPRGALLLQAYDETVVGYTESRFLGDPRALALRSARANHTVPNGFVLVNGRVAGHFRRTMGRRVVEVEVVTYDDLGPAGLRAIGAAVDAVGRAVARRAVVTVRRL